MKKGPPKNITPKITTNIESASMSLRNDILGAYMPEDRDAHTPKDILNIQTHVSPRLVNPPSLLTGQDSRRGGRSYSIGAHHSGPGRNTGSERKVAGGRQKAKRATIEDVPQLLGAGKDGVAILLPSKLSAKKSQSIGNGGAVSSPVGRKMAPK